MNVVFGPAAVDDLERIFGWIAKDNEPAALKVLELIEKQVGRLAHGFPHVAVPAASPVRVSSSAHHT